MLTQPFRWYGSKVKMRKNILDIIATIPRKLYVEPFGGSASIFFGKAPEKSIYNDTNSLLTNFFRKLRSDSDRAVIARIASFTPESRTFRDEMKDVCQAYQSGDSKRLEETLRIANLCDYDESIAVAFAFFYCQNFSFGGTFLHSYGEKITVPTSAPTYARRIAYLDEYSKYLALCNITERDFRECITKHDDKETLFYLDPPYEVATNIEYKCAWNSDDTSELVEMLCNIKGSAVLSCYYGELYEPLLFAGYSRRDFRVNSTIRYGSDTPCDFERVETILFRRADRKNTDCNLFTLGETS